MTEQATQRLRDLEAVLRAVADYLDAIDDETTSRRSSRRARTLTALRAAAARVRGATR